MNAIARSLQTTHRLLCRWGNDGCQKTGEVIDAPDPVAAFERLGWGVGVRDNEPVVMCPSCVQTEKAK